jgi:uncharacterized protein YjaZ
MKRSLIFICCISFFSNVINLKAQNKNSEYIINKEGGRIILAYKHFEDFLNSDKSWANYKKLVFETCPEMRAIHKNYLNWGKIDSLKFQNDMKSSKIEDWAWCLDRYDKKTLNYLYDSIIAKENVILPPLKKQSVDLIFFIPYPGCFVLFENGKSLICISLFIDPKEASKIMTHEYAHCLYNQRHPKEPLSLKGEIVSEGFAVYLTTLSISSIEISDAVPFMPSSSFKWCLDNESAIKDSVQSDFENSKCDFIRKYIADGKGYSNPPNGFVEKTGYFVGYRIIKACIDKGLKIEEICSLSSAEIIKKSGYFEN